MPATPSSFVARGLVFAFLCMLMASAFHHLITYGLRRSGVEEFGDWNAILSGKIEADCIILGSSVAMHDVSPRHLDERLGLRSYCLGLPGQNFHGHRCRYRLYRSRHRAPRLLLCFVTPLTLSDELKYLPVQFVPYLDEPIIAEHVRRGDLLSPMAIHLPLVAFAGETRTVIHGLREALGLFRQAPMKQRGYLPETANWKEWHETHVEKPIPFEKQHTMVVNPELTEDFRQFLLRQRDEGIRIVLVMPPFHTETMNGWISNCDELAALHRRIARETDTPLLDYSRHPMTLDRTGFFNVTHLNQRGAERFTAILAEDLKSLGQASLEKGGTPPPDGSSLRPRGSDS